MRTLIVDNYDSFTFNLFQLVGELGGDPQVLRNDELGIGAILDLAPERIILSPGPGRADDPRRVGVSTALVRSLGATVPILGVCLGHQGLGHAFGAKIVRSPAPRHGKTSTVFHDGSRLFRAISAPSFEAMRYHSLTLERRSLPSCLRLTAWTEDGLVMGIEHTELPIFGVQFHPESVGTPEGPRIVKSFLDYDPRARAREDRSAD